MKMQMLRLLISFSPLLTPPAVSSVVAIVIFLKFFTAGGKSFFLSFMCVFSLTGSRKSFGRLFLLLLL